MGLVKSLIFWAIGIAVALLLYKIAMKDFESREGIMGEGSQAADKEDVATTGKHFKITAAVNCAALVIATFIPFQFVRWIATIACGFVLPPVFYDVFYNCIPKTRQSKLHFALTLASIINLLLIVFTLNYLYWTYLHKVFV